MSSAPATKQARLSEPSPLVYEVNIDVDNDTAVEFEAWLRPHALELLDLPDCHFTVAEIFAVDGEDGAPRKKFCVQYRVEDCAGLGAYLNVQAPRLHGDAAGFADKILGAYLNVHEPQLRGGAARFADKITITRHVHTSNTTLHPAAAASGGSAASVAAAGGGGRHTVTFVTGNVKKLEEVKAILAAGAPLPCDITNAKLDLPELQGEPEEVAIEKVKLAAEKIGGAALTEDTSLCFNALGGLPGVYIKWFLDKLGHVGLNNMLAAYDDKSAYAQCIFAYCASPGAEPVTFVGRTEGKIVGARGPLDFGWDPVFEPDEGGGKTFAEMAKPDKNAISHRGRSLAKLKEYLQVHG